MTRRALVLFSLLMIVTPALAVVTTKFALDNSAWVDLGAGPMLLHFTGAGVYAIADATPTIPKGEGFTLLSGESFRVETTSHVWAMAKDSLGVIAYVSAY